MSDGERVRFTAEGLEEPGCNACGSADCRVLFERESGRDSEEAFAATTDAFQEYGRVVECENCGLARRSPRQRWEFLRRAYRQMQDPRYLEEYPGRVASARRLLKFLERHVQPGRLLDIGCGVGVIPAVAQDRWQATGVELSSWAVREARTRFNADVMEGTLEDARFPDASFAAVTMLDVIEHLPNPKETLAEAHRILRPGGVLFMLTPDLGAPLARAMGRWWWGLRPAHLYYFSRKSVVSLLESQGFETRNIGYWGRSFTLGYWISRMKGYAPTLTRMVEKSARVAGISRIPLYLNTFDSIGVLALKKTG